MGIPPAQAAAVGRRIWKNECEGTITGLTSWNSGESFPSLGIGHFIWYPRGGEDRFQESFPGLLDYFRERGVTVPRWLSEAGYCPWSTKKEFDAARNSLHMHELRHLLVSTVSIQADYIARRLATALPRMTATLPDRERHRVNDRFQALFQTPGGLYALMDYVNFKGEGIKATERYKRQGWGMLQVLQGMRGCSRGTEAVKEFAASACRVLARRVFNAPPERRSFEKRNLPGWKSRVQSYLHAIAP
ncbi:MAG: hypothetical protein WA705_21345 [Candidatus Ozemobacteraceae bacterium]